jgi:hypothetical protein
MAICLFNVNRGASSNRLSNELFREMHLYWTYCL